MAALTFLLPVAGLAAPVAGPARADGSPPDGVTFGSFTLTARADATDLGVVDPGAPIVPEGQLITGSPASAQSSLDSLGQSSAFASSPYPGELAATLPGTINGLVAGRAPSVPNYPFYVSSSYPTQPSSSNVQGPYGISATSSQTTSVADARVGLATGSPGIASMRAHSEALQNPDGSLLADATSDVEGVAVGQVLRIGSVVSHARLTLAPGQEPQLTTSLQLGTMTVAGTPIGLTDKGIVVGGATAPGPDPSAVEAVLRNAGVEVTYLPASTSPTSVRSASIGISYTTNVPNQGNVVTTLTLGQVSATIESTVVPSILPARGQVVAPGSGLPATSTQGTAATAGPAEVAGLPSGGTGPSAAPAGPVVASPAPAAQAIPAGRVVLPKDPSGRVFYLALVLAAVALVGLPQLLRLLGVRRAGLPPVPTE